MIENELEVVGWVDWDDYPDHTGPGSYDEIFDLVVAAARRDGCRFAGEYHQNGAHGAPLLSDGTVASFTFRGWGGVMAAAWPEWVTIQDPQVQYCEYAWFDPRFNEIEGKYNYPFEKKYNDNDIDDLDELIEEVDDYA